MKINFRCVLKELGFQAGQHEVLAEALMNTVQTKIKTKVKELHKVTDQYKKEIKNQQQVLDQSYKGLDKIKTKYAKACMEWYAGQVIKYVYQCRVTDAWNICCR